MVGAGIAVDDLAEAYFNDIDDGDYKSQIFIDYAFIFLAEQLVRRQFLGLTKLFRRDAKDVLYRN